MPSFIRFLRDTRRSKVVILSCSAAILLLLANIPSSRAVHAASRVQAAQPPAATAGRMTVLVFDLTSMNADEVSRAANASRTFVDQQLSNGDLVSVVTVSPSLRVVSDFTSEPADLQAALTPAALRNGTLNGAALTGQGDTGADARLRAIRTLCQTIAPLQQRKSMMYFAGGIAASAPGASADVQTALNDATNACRRANVLLYPVDVRGLAAIAGSPRQGPGGADLFNGPAK
jgi:VWFA-related protein